MRICLFISIFLIISPGFSQAYEIERFELLNTASGLSHNSVLSLFCDSRGYIWAGTMDGLNRYNGYAFDIFKTEKNNPFSLNNNRITSIWEDEKGFIWLRSHDGYLHYFDYDTERFYNFPNTNMSEDSKGNSILCFKQLNEDEIWLGSVSSGAYMLKYVADSVYSLKQFRSRGVTPITNNRVSFVCEDSLHNIWIGTDQGLNKISDDNRASQSFLPTHYLVDHSFTASMSTSSHLWFGTKHHGVIRYQPVTEKFLPMSLGKEHDQPEITLFHLTRDKHYMVIGTVGEGCWFYNRSNGESRQIPVKGNSVKSVYEDNFGSIWITTDAFGVTMVNLPDLNPMHFMLSPAEDQKLIDEERQFFFEDSKQGLWIGTHGGGLASFDREKMKFNFYRNDPDNPKSIGSDFVYSIIEDKAGLLWVGTGQFNGGLSKAVPVNPGFKELIPVNELSDYAENVIRCIFEDDLGNIWLANKAGQIFIYDLNWTLINTLSNIPLAGKINPGMNIYTMMQDRDGFLWLGSKGGGIAVSTKPLESFSKNYRDIQFHLYQQTDSRRDGLSSDMIYTIKQDREGLIWIGTYGGGINLVQNRDRTFLKCKVINGENSNLQSDFIRHIYEDSRGRLWLATTMGIHYLEGKHDQDSLIFSSFIYDQQDPGSISYNDIIHIFEDAASNLWFATFGGGLNMLQADNLKKGSFKAIDQDKGLINNAVFAILQDSLGYIWASTENGLSRIDPDLITIENFNAANGLQSSNFNENACLVSSSGNLIFGSTEGALIVSPGNIEKINFAPPVVFTNLYISNSLVDIKTEDSPLRKHINSCEEIILQHTQSSFSLEYAALSYFDPSKNQYRYMLENYDDGWSYMNNERRATYTKVPPGDYTFLVKAANWDGTWNEEPRSLHIVIRPPWWKTTAAKIIYIFLLLALIELSRRIFMNYYRLRNDLMIEKRINEIKLQFFTNISHEIRTPLTLILGPVADIKKVRNLPDSILEPLETIQRNSKRMLRLVNQLLDFRKIQNKKMQLNIQQVNLSGFLTDICRNFDYLALQKGLRFVYPVNLPETLFWFDPEKMDTVLFNILSNAFKFTPPGKSIKVEVHVPESLKSIEIIITDEGDGIPEEKLSLMFQRYTTLATENMTLTGTGIGLAFANEIVKAHNGELTVESKLKKGSKFKIQIPGSQDAYRSEDINTTQIAFHAPVHETQDLVFSEQDRLEDSGELNTEGTQSKPTLLLVEDHYDIRQYISKILNTDFNVIEAVNGLDGLKKLDQNNPDLIITDIMMAEMDGREMTRRIKNDFNTSHIPVIMLTAKSTMDDQIDGIESGAEAYILKPFNAQHLKAVISNLLHQRQLLRQNLMHKKDYEPSEIKITNRDEQFINDIICIIEENYHLSDFNVDRLAELSKVGRTVFYSKIKSLTGIPPVQFLRQVRIKIGAQILIKDGYNVGEVAYMTGFNDIKYFRKCFKEVFGMTPSEYKEKNHQKLSDKN